MRIGVIVIGIVITACAGSKATNAPTTTSVASTPAITMAPFKLIPTAKPERAVDVQADGTAFVGGKMTMKFVDNELRAPDGQTILSLAKDGTVTLHRKDNAEEIVGTLNERDEFSPKRKESHRMWLDDNGALKLLGVPDPEPGKEPLKFEAVGATNRRAAMLVTILFFTAPAPATAKAEAADQPAKATK
jgi:hypothetical protein